MKDRIEILRYKLVFPDLNKKLMDMDRNRYHQAIILTRLNELQEKNSMAVKICNANSKGTAIIFQPVKDLKEYVQELEKIMRDGELHGLQFRGEGETEVYKERDHGN